MSIFWDIKIFIPYVLLLLLLASCKVEFKILNKYPWTRVLHVQVTPLHEQVANLNHMLGRNLTNPVNHY